MSDSSSEDEIPQELLESVDKDFMNDSLFTKETREGAFKKDLKLPSLRPKDEENDIYTHTGLTKSNQIFIAKRLSEQLDVKLKNAFVQFGNKNRSKRSDNVPSRIFLFSNSSDYVSYDNEDHYSDVNKVIREKRKIISDGISDTELMDRCRTVAVSSDWVLSGDAIKGWSKTTKGEVIHAKKLKSSKNPNVIECEIIK